MAYQNLKNNPEIIKAKTKDVESKELNNPVESTEKHDHEKVLKYLKFDNEYYRKKNKSLYKKRYY